MHEKKSTSKCNNTKAVKTIPSPSYPNLQLKNYKQSITTKLWLCCLKMSVCGMIAIRDLFLLEKYKNSITLSHGIAMEGIVIGIPGRYSYYWNMSWICNNIPNSIDMEYLWTKGMKCNKNM